MRKSSSHSLDSDEFKQLAYNQVIPQVNSMAILDEGCMGIRVASSGLTEKDKTGCDHRTVLH